MRLNSGTHHQVGVRSDSWPELVILLQGALQVQQELAAVTGNNRQRTVPLVKRSATGRRRLPGQRLLAYQVASAQHRQQTHKRRWIHVDKR